MKQCENCNKPISDGVAWYSLRQYGEELCLACQLARKQNRNGKLTTDERMDMIQDQSYKWGEPRY